MSTWEKIRFVIQQLYILEEEITENIVPIYNEWKDAKDSIIVEQTGETHSTIKELKFQRYSLEQGKKLNPEKIKKILRENLQNSTKNYPVYFVDDIKTEKEKKKFSNALNSYAKSVDPNNVIAFMDTTVFGGAKEGVLFATDCIAAKEIAESPFLVKYDDIEEFETDSKEKNLILISNIEKDNPFRLSSTYFDLYALEKLMREITGL